MKTLWKQSELTAQDEVAIGDEIEMDTPLHVGIYGRSIHSVVHVQHGEATYSTPGVWSGDGEPHPPNRFIGWGASEKSSSTFIYLQGDPYGSPIMLRE